MIKMEVFTDYRITARRLMSDKRKPAVQFEPAGCFIFQGFYLGITLPF